MIIWKEIDTVLLDMDGTLLDLHFDNYFWKEYLPQKWGERNNLDIDTAKEALMPGFYQWAGTLAWYDLDHWSDHLGMDILTLKADLGHMIKERPAALEFLQFLIDSGKQIALVTNAHQGLIDMKFNCTKLGDYFDDVFCSHAFGFPKEDVQFWEAFRLQYSFDPSRTLFIDDNISVLHSAQKYGIQYLLSIAKPDSTKPNQEQDDFPAIESFMDLISLSEK
ncbi:MAG: HAD superfamily hydrolase (TIGR01509 family) [Gammaproteobacteria bacterium]|jgi:HAD superfamily hydrolase (TIGR01509 family)